MLAASIPFPVIKRQGPFPNPFLRHSPSSQRKQYLVLLQISATWSNSFVSPCWLRWLACLILLLLRLLLWKSVPIQTQNTAVQAARDVQLLRMVLLRESIKNVSRYLLICPSCHDGHCGYYCIEYYAKYDGYCKSVGSDPKNCGKIGHKCYVPSHGHATCSKGVCGVTCIHGYHPDEDNDYCVKNGPTKSPLPPIERERVKRSIDEFEQQVLGIMNPPVILQSPCKQDEQACHLLRADGTSSTTFECVNIMSDVFSCGKCQTPQRDEDCTRLPNIQSARCHMGQCKVSSCLPGFTQVNSTACVPI